jgi:hypothetical protein
MARWGGAPLSSLPLSYSLMPRCTFQHRGWALGVTSRRALRICHCTAPQAQAAACSQQTMSKQVRCDCDFPERISSAEAVSGISPFMAAVHRFRHMWHISLGCPVMLLCCDVAPKMQPIHLSMHPLRWIGCCSPCYHDLIRYSCYLGCAWEAHVWRPFSCLKRNFRAPTDHHGICLGMAMYKPQVDRPRC